MTKLQFTLIPLPKPVCCARCGQTQAEVLTERDLSAFTFRAHGPDGQDQPPEYSTAPCCDPEDEQPSCPRCGSAQLEYGFHFATHYQELEGEVAHCRTCGWSGEVAEIEPVVIPKPMGRAVAAADLHPAAA